MCLDQVKTGDEIIIKEIPDSMAKTQFIRFGIGEGSTVVCHTKIPFGPVVLRKNRQEIAVGRELARTIRVERRGNGGKGHRRG
ncbi:MAG: ferrous iron transport protein A [Candidatus Aquicultor secundus]|uniref:Ferrous iron transport protein A n=1 Tax=Candidatus Aquicultor secundus TaxID=1973895 RepID=A0A2M7TBU0_9ACTN|nr:ferrous iron transport protein A [Candidatus Aquicultor secundus]NCO66248.1 ferrous iron transport protein A [Solirubrobacter sp.]OIO84190.1 MAG: ferrous iron transport protein A [Candidatus Aquicultor secundus]PIU26386.1 MAG: ferrous iron transport protein A [Candidatus Aquicultor secundus]PIW23027.1 MAG: ferrous iron transport protein A [Candidatus Aquicultor secundus]PIX51548.1 MAG: ferrous iron transport protein A [Candidatus Aquicultor secundus]